MISCFTVMFAHTQDENKIFLEKCYKICAINIKVPLQKRIIFRILFKTVFFFIYGLKIQQNFLEYFVTRSNFPRKKLKKLVYTQKHNYSFDF